MKRQRRDWEALVQEYVAMKIKEPFMTQNEFFRRKGMALPAGNRRIGPRMALAWSDAQKAATREVIESMGLDLAEEVKKQLKIGRSAMALGARNILPRVADDGTELPALHQPMNFQESYALAKLGLETVREAVRLLTGGEPLLPPEQIQGAIEWVEPPASPGLSPEESPEEASS